MRDPFDHGPRSPADERGAADPADLADFLTETERRLKRLRPCQPQINLAMIEKLADAQASPIAPNTAGVTKTQFAYALAGSWLCGVAVGAALLLLVVPRSVDPDSLAPSAVSKDSFAIHPGVRDPQVVSGNSSADRFPQEIASAADDSLPSEESVNESVGGRSFAATIPDDRYHAIGLSRVFNDQPLRVTSLRRWLDQDPPTLAQADALVGRVRPEGSGLRQHERADGSSARNGTGGEPLVPRLEPDPSVPMTRQQLLDRLIADPLATFL